MLITAVLAWSSFKVVPPGQRGVSVTLGHVSPNMCGEGFNLKKPLIEGIEIMNIRQLRRDGDAACFSSDLQTVHIHYVVLYRVPEAKVVTLYQSYHGDPYEALVDSRIQEVLKQVTAGYAAEALVKSREEMREKTISRVRIEVGDLIEIVDVNIANIDLTDELEKAIESKMVQAQQALAKQYELEKAKKDAEITVVNATAEAQSVKIKGEALAQAPRVIELEIAKKWDGKAPTTLVVGPGGGGGAQVVFPVEATGK